MQVLPPINSVDPVGADRSPYDVSLISFVTRFATTKKRCEIVRGFLRFRSTLHGAGIVSGFHWINGSFTEHVEVLENRDPGDVDLVTFLDDPTDNLEAIFPDELIDHDEVKKNFLVDNYWVETSLPGRELVNTSAYWYSLWAHRRNAQWKGFLQIDLDPQEDTVALQELDSIQATFSPPGTPDAVQTV